MQSLLRGSLLIIFYLLILIGGDRISTQAVQSDIRENSGVDPDWHIFSSPIKNQISQIFMFSGSDGILCGKIIGGYNGKKWSIFPKQPPSLNTTRIFTNNRNNIWATFNTYSSESRLFRFVDGNWRKENHPFANAITAMHLSQDGIDWLGGDREIAYKKDNLWKFVPFPKCIGPISYIFPVSENQAWVSTADLKLFFFNGKQWRQYLKSSEVRYVWFENKNRGYFLTNDSLLFFDGKNVKLHSTNPYLKFVSKLFFLTDTEIYGIGPGALLLHYIGRNWESVKVPTFEDFYDIFMVSPTEGWIVGNNGLILKYSKSKVENSHPQEIGFNQIKIIPISKTINDEYGVAIEDLDNDGRKDVYTVCIYEPNRFYHNKSAFDPSGRIISVYFNEEAALRGLRGVSEDNRNSNFSELDIGVGVADIDNDGDEDIYLTNLLSKNKLLLNDGNGYFRNVSDQKNRGTGEDERTNAAIWGDVDNDGDLDLFITNEYTSNRLYLNDGDGFFTEITKNAGLESVSGGMGASFSDIDGDGDLDLCVANWASTNLLYRNVSTKESGVKFVNISDSAGISGEFFSKSNAVVFADIDNDGDQDLFITKRKQSNRLYLNNGKGIFKDVTQNYLGIDSMLSYGAIFADFDQDGFQDLYVANVGNNILYKNIGGKKFLPVTERFNAGMSGYNTGSACGDIDNDGDIDMYVANYINGNSTLFLNTVQNGQYIKFKISGTKSNRDAVGVKIWLYKSGYSFSNKALVGYREISGGSGYCSYNTKEVHFGLPEKGLFDALIFFPTSGIKKELKKLSPGKIYTISEEDGFKRNITLFIKFMSRLVSDPENQLEFFKIFIVLIFISASSIVGKRRYHWDKRKILAFDTSILVLYFIQVFLFRYKGFFLTATLPISSVLIMIAILHLIYEKIITVRISAEEKKMTRDRIARDLHDDLASTLSSSAIYLESLKQSLKNISNTDSQLIYRITSLLQEASESITDIVWAVSPFHDKLDDLILRLREFLTEYCKSHGIEYKVDISVAQKEMIINDDIRRNVFLIFKEAINNIVKHSNATFVQFSVNYDSLMLYLKLEDNGIGFEKKERQYNIKPIKGHGLANIEKRAEEIGAYLSIISAPGKGTKISVSIKMT